MRTVSETARPRPVFVPPGVPAYDGDATDDVRPVLRVASFPRRLAGRLLDICAVLTSFALIFCVAVFVPLMVWHRLPDALIVTLMVTMVTAGAASFLVLRIGLLAWWGCTVGQRIAGTRVVDRSDGALVRGWRRAFRRWFIMRGRHSLGPLEDAWRMFGDPELRRCDHDRKAGTVVIVAPAVAPAASGLGPDGVPSSADPDRISATARRERTCRVALAAALGAAVLTIAASATVPPLRKKIGEAQGPPFAVDTFYDDRRHFDVRSPTGRTGTFDRTAGRALDGADGCRSAGVDGRVRGLLAELGCQGQVEVAFQTSDGVVRATGHVLKFADASAASRAAGRLRWSDLRFVSSGPPGPPGPPGTVRGGMLDHTGRYVVVTSVVAPKGPGTAEKAKNALILLHTPTVNTILFL